MSHFSTVRSYTQARSELASLCDEVASSRQAVLIKRRNAQDVALVSADELSGLIETAHLLRSPKNAERLLEALARAKAGVGAPSTIEDLRRELKLEAEADELA